MTPKNYRREGAFHAERPYLPSGSGSTWLQRLQAGNAVPPLQSEVLAREIAVQLLGSSGGGRIRTHGTLTSAAVFKTAALDHSATPPCNWRRAGIWWIGGPASRRAAITGLPELKRRASSGDTRMPTRKGWGAAFRGECCQ